MRLDTGPYLLEPTGRNTAPAIAAAAFAVKERFGEDAIMLVLPADHLIQDTAAFVAALAPADAAGNRISGDAVVVGARDCYIRSEDRIVAAIGVDKLLVIDTPDALLIAHRDQAQEVKAMVQQLNARGHESARIHRTVHRPCPRGPSPP